MPPFHSGRWAALRAAVGRCNIRCKNYVLGAGQLRYDDPMTFATALVTEGGTCLYRQAVLRRLAQAR